MIFVIGLSRLYVGFGGEVVRIKEKSTGKRRNAYSSPKIWEVKDSDP